MAETFTGQFIEEEARREIERVAARGSLREFTRKTWAVRESTPFQDNWVIGCLCEHFQACYEGEIRRLLINIYPRSLKSTIASVMFPAWVWGQSPQERFFYMTYAQSLALRDARHTREVFDSRQFKEIFPNAFGVTKDTEGLIENDKTGSRLSIGSGAQQTGFGARFKIFDDPNDTNKVDSPVNREEVNGRIDNFSTRSDDFTTDCFILIQQRTHPKDATGHVKELGLKFEEIVIPLEYQGKKYVTCLGPIKDPRTEKGELADKMRFAYDPRTGVDPIKELKKSLGYRFSGQANQDPRTPEGNAVRRNWYEPFVLFFEPKDIIQVVLSYDISFTDSYTGDWTWGSLKAKKKDGSFLTLRQHFGHWNDHDRPRKIGEFGLQAKRMMEVLFPNVKWELTLETGVGAGVAITKSDIKYLLSIGLPARAVEIKKQAKPVRAIAYLASCQGGFTKFYDGPQLNDFFGTEDWINSFFDVTLPLIFSDDGLEFLNGNDDPIDAEVMAHDGLTKPPRDWTKYRSA